MNNQGTQNPVTQADFLGQVQETEAQAEETVNTALEKKRRQVEKLKESLRLANEKALDQDRQMKKKELEQARIQARANYEEQVQSGADDARKLVSSKSAMIPNTSKKELT